MKRFNEFSINEAETVMGQAKSAKRVMMNKKIDLLKTRIDYYRSKGMSSSPAYMAAQQQLSKMRAELSKI